MLNYMRHEQRAPSMFSTPVCVCVAVSAVCILTSLPLAKADASEAADESAMESIILFG